VACKLLGCGTNRLVRLGHFGDDKANTIIIGADWGVNGAKLGSCHMCDHLMYHENWSV
jgi:hypothetical protein